MWGWEWRGAWGHEQGKKWGLWLKSTAQGEVSAYKFYPKFYQKLS